MMRLFAGTMWVALSAALISGCNHLAGKSKNAIVSPIDIAGSQMSEALSAEALDIERLSTAVVHETNQVRRRLGLTLLKRLPQLDQAADLQASSNALNQVASHDNIIAAWATPFDRVSNLGRRPSLVSENAGVLH